MLVPVKVGFMEGYPGRCPIFVWPDECRNPENAHFELDDNFVRDMRIEYVHSGKQTNFTTQLIRLMGKADSSNINKLSQVWRSEMLAVWLCKRDQEYYDMIIRGVSSVG